MNRVFAILLLIASGCSSGSLEQRAVQKWLADINGNDPITIVRWGKPVRSNQVLADLVNEKLASAVKERDERQASNDAEIKVLQDKGSDTLEQWREVLKTEIETLNAGVNSIEKMKESLPVTFIELLYRVPNSKGDNELNRSLFIIKDGKVIHEMYDPQKSEQHLFVAFYNKANS